MHINTVSNAILPPAQASGTQQAVALKVLKDAIDFQGELALQLLPKPAAVDPVSALGQNVDIRV